MSLKINKSQQTSGRGMRSGKPF